jgi:hypothetical protein
MLERLIEYIKGHAGVSWLTREEIAAGFRQHQPFAPAIASGR